MEGADSERLIRLNLQQALCNVLPITKWLPSYSIRDIYGDFIAGLTVALAAIPQSMAYAVLAGLSPQFGLYSSFLAPFVYVFLGGCRQVTVGPTAVSALLAYETCGNNFPDCVILVAFYAGVIEIALALLRLGYFVALISDPVTLGFTTGAVLTIASSQLKNFLGYSSSKETKFLGYLEAVIENWNTISIADAVMGFSCLSLLFLLQNLNRIFALFSFFVNSRLLKIVLKVLSVSRNAIVVAGASIVAFYWPYAPPFKLTGYVKPGLPNLTVPKFCLANKWDNGTSHETEILSFTDTLGKLGFGPCLVALVAILQNVAISKAYGIGQRVDGNQEMLSLGVTSIMGGFISAQPVSASFSRSALNDASGVRSQFSGFFTGSIIMISLAFLTSAFAYIPKGTLAAVIIAAVLGMLNFQVLVLMWKISRIDVATYTVTFLSSVLLSMELGIGLGVGFSILVFLYKFISAKLLPEFYDEDPSVKYIILRCPQALNFPDVDNLRKYVHEYAIKFEGMYHAIVLDCLKWNTFDFTGVAAICDLLKTTKIRGIHLILLHVSEDLKIAFRNFGLSEDEILYFTCDNELSLKETVQKLRCEFDSDHYEQLLP